MPTYLPWKKCDYRLIKEIYSENIEWKKERIIRRYKSTTTRKTVGLILTLKGSAIFTAEPQRTLREIFFSFPLRGRKAKILSPTGHDGIIIQGQIPVHDAGSTLNGCMFSLCCPLNSKGKSIHSANFATRAKRAVKNILSLTSIAKLGPSA